jgi:hypothetical protein
MCGVINRALKRQVRAGTMFKFHKVMTIPKLLSRSETWVKRTIKN